MNKLQITNIRMYNLSWFAVKFSGSKAAFIAMTSHLKGYTKQGAYYRQGEFGGQGGWIIRKDVLERHSERFEDYEAKTRIARETYEAERLKRA